MVRPKTIAKRYDDRNRWVRQDGRESYREFFICRVVLTADRDQSCWDALDRHRRVDGEVS